MQSSTRNVKLGVCRVYFDGDDLGLTQGGVEVTVATETHKVNVDQMGKTAINEIIMGREVKVKVPMAETTIENMAKIMPGAVLSTTGGVKATGTITIATNPANNDTIVVNGATITFKTALSVPAVWGEVLIGAAATNTATNLAAALNAHQDERVALADYSAAGAVVTATYEGFGTEGNAFTLNAGTAGAKVTLSGATLAGGTEPTKKSITVDHGIGADLLASAKELRLHPTAAGASKADDFVIPLANTPGALNFAYKLDQERIYEVEFTGYPDPTTGKLFIFGDNT